MNALCHACKAKGEEAEAVSIIAVGVKVWDLCQVHTDRFEAHLADLFRDTGAAEPVKERPAVVVTGEIPGYGHDTARTAIENLGYRIVGHVEADTEVIVCGLRPAPHKVAEAREHGTPAFDATEPKALARAICSGDLALTRESVDDLPIVQAMQPKKTAADVRKETDEQAEARRKREADAMRSYVKWRQTEVPKRMAESSAQWAEERQKKEDAETRRIVKAKLPPELSEAEKIRTWAKENGYQVSNKGRIPTAVRVAYEHAHAGQEALDVEAS
ncbi:histone-like nucleoid-structuring protein Lsr2 [Streptomyces chattanoogensis]|uniref:Lsr2 family DNA-binding protein n=1 Tax=Streptomyces chattanoogensis TaxID=66876 RepID=UPI0036877703